MSKRKHAPAGAIDPQVMADAAALLRRVLALVDAGELTASTPQALALLRRLEGAAMAAEIAGGRPPAEPPKTPPLQDTDD